MVIVQALHSLEEYTGRLYEVFPPARFVSGLFSENLERGVVLFNVALVSFGLWCFLWPAAAAGDQPFFARIWVGIEVLNGIGYLLWSVTVLRYNPAVVTAPFLLLLALYFVWQLRIPREQTALLCAQESYPPLPLYAAQDRAARGGISPSRSPC